VSLRELLERAGNIMDLDEIRERDRQLSQEAPAGDALAMVLKGSPLEKTGEVMSSLLANLESLKSGMLDVAESGNAYAMNALFRAFLEHMLKLLGVFLKSINDRSDDFAKLFQRLLVVEAGQYVKAIEAAKLDAGAAKHSALAPWFKEAAAMSNKEREAAESPFKYKRLIETIHDLAALGVGPQFLRKIVPNYAELSGFVHGGPSTTLILKAIPPDQMRAKLVHDAGLVVHMTGSAKRWLLMIAAAVRPELESQLERFSNALDGAD
jgi:hypothetical protein